jgi:hypothetical protein
MNIRLGDERVGRQPRPDEPYPNDYYPQPYPSPLPGSLQWIVL